MVPERLETGKLLRKQRAKRSGPVDGDQNEVAHGKESWSEMLLHSITWP